MYTLTRKLSVVCLTVVLSFLVYGCGGSSKQALITDVSTDMVTAGLAPDQGTYSIQPGKSATAGDVTFACPPEGSPCEITVDDDGNIVMSPSAEGMATAMNSVSAIARLAAEQAQADAETERDAANAAAMLAATAQADAETARDAANAAAMLAATAQADAETARDAANAAAMTAETERDAANAAAMLAATAQADAETARDAANAAAMLAATAQADAETARDAANAAAMLAATAQADAETARDAANAAAMLSATERDAANAAAMTAETERDAANAAAMLSATERDAANAAAMLAATAQAEAETERDDANAAAMLAATAQAEAETARDDANAAAMLAATAQAEAETERDAANAAAMLAATAQAEAETERDAAIALAESRTKLTIIVPDLAVGYDTATSAIHKLAANAVMNVGDIKFTCVGEVPCVVVVTVTVDEVNGEDVTTTTYTSLGGVATVENSDAVVKTRAAIALHPLHRESEDDQNTGLNNATVLAPMIVVTRKTRVGGGDTTITLTQSADEEDEGAVKYKDKVDTTHGIDEWPHKTMVRFDATDLPNQQEATVYTNIKPAMPQTLKLTGQVADDPFAVPDTSTSPFVLEADQDSSETLSIDNTARSFRGAYGDISGTFTCADDVSCTPVTTAEDAISGERILTARLTVGWEFESDMDEEVAAAQDKDYMYFGYWLQFPEDAGIAEPEYRFAVIRGGATLFEVPSGLTDNNTSEKPLRAIYEGGAAGRYVTRNLRIKNQAVDPQSPGNHGRFTAKATLTADFGMHDDFAADDETMRENTQNMVYGDITDFKDGSKDLDFSVELEPATITPNSNMITGETDADFSDNATGRGAWSAQFYGPSAQDLMDADEESTATDANTLPTGVAGQFDAQSRYMNIVGAFAAEKQ